MEHDDRGRRAGAHVQEGGADFQREVDKLNKSIGGIKR